MSFEKEKKVFSKIFESFGFEYEIKGKHGDIWKHKLFNLTISLPTSASDNRWIKNKKSEISKLVSDSFSIEEVKKLLKPFIKKRKIEFTKDGRVRLLRISTTTDLKELKREKKEQEDWRKILNDLPTDLDLESELIILLLNRGEPKTDFVSEETIREMTGDDNPYDVDGVEFKKIRVKNITDKRGDYEDEDTKRKNKEKLKELEKKRKVVEEKILEEIRKFGGDEKLK